VRSDPEQLSASLSDDYHGACVPLGLQRLAIIRRSGPPTPPTVETVAEDLGRHVEYLWDRLLRREKITPRSPATYAEFPLLADVRDD
jgi:hypothetical protein